MSLNIVEATLVGDFVAAAQGAQEPTLIVRVGTHQGVVEDIRHATVCVARFEGGVVPATDRDVWDAVEMLLPKGDTFPEMSKAAALPRDVRTFALLNLYARARALRGVSVDAVRAVGAEGLPEREMVGEFLGTFERTLIVSTALREVVVGWCFTHGVAADIVALAFAYANLPMIDGFDWQTAVMSDDMPGVFDRFAAAHDLAGGEVLVLAGSEIDCRMAQGRSPIVLVTSSSAAQFVITPYLLEHRNLVIFVTNTLAPLTELRG